MNSKDLLKKRNQCNASIKLNTKYIYKCPIKELIKPGLPFKCNCYYKSKICNSISCENAKINWSCSA